MNSNIWAAAIMAAFGYWLYSQIQPAHIREANRANWAAQQCSYNRQMDAVEGLIPSRRC